MLHKNSIVADSMICDGCTIESGAQVINSILSPGVYVHSGAVIREAILFTDCVVEKNASITRAILDKRVLVGENARIGDITPGDIKITMVGKNSIVPPHSIIEAGGILGTDLIASDYTKKTVKSDETLITRRQSYEF